MSENQSTVPIWIPRMAGILIVKVVQDVEPVRNYNFGPYTESE